MRQTSSAVQSVDYARGHPVQDPDTQFALMRGLAHGVILSMMVWTVALYVTMVLR